MSKIGKKVIEIPAGVEVNVNGSTVIVKGPKGTLTQTFVPQVTIKVEDNTIVTSVPSQDERNLRGLTRTLLSNMVVGVTHGYEKKLLVMGVGYAVKLEGKKLVLSLGLSHKVNFEIPQGIETKVEQDVKGNFVVTMSGIDKQYLGEVVAKFKSLKKPEPYKGKGIRYLDEYIKLKPGKAAKK